MLLACDSVFPAVVLPRCPVRRRTAPPSCFLYTDAAALRIGSPRRKRCAVPPRRATHQGMARGPTNSETTGAPDRVARAGTGVTWGDDAMMDALARNWWAIALRGVVAILFGLVALFDARIALYALVIVFGAYALVDGVFNVVAAVRAAEHHQRWIWLLVSGIAGILAGLITFAWPGITALVLLYLIAYWAIVTGVLELIAGYRLKGHVANEWALLLGGAASIIFGVLLIVHPLVGALAVLWLIGVYAIVFGVLMLILSLRLRRHAGAGATP